MRGKNEYVFPEEEKKELLAYFSSNIKLFCSIFKLFATKLQEFVMIFTLFVYPSFIKYRKYTGCVRKFVFFVRFLAIFVRISPVYARNCLLFVRISTLYIYPYP